jgi:hypothetical protein
LQFRAGNVHRADLRFGHALDVNVYGEAHIAVPKNRLNGLVVHAQLMQRGCEPAPESVPLRERLVQPELMPITLVRRLRLSAHRTPFEGGDNHAPRKVVQVERLSLSRLEDRADSQLAPALLVRFGGVGKPKSRVNSDPKP